MAVIQYRWMDFDEVGKIADIDRSERIRTGYVNEGGQLTKMEVNWDTPAFFPEGDGEHTVSAQIDFCSDHLRRMGRMYGAFDGDNLVGIGLLQHDVRDGIAQLAYLHVSKAYRRQGIASRITKELIREAQRDGANQIYVSATPSGSAVGFYLDCGFEPVETPIPELYDLEPEDIHMIKEL